MEGTRVLRSGRMLTLPESFDVEALGRGVLRLFAHSTRTALVLLDPSACLIWANPAFDALGLSTGDGWLGRGLMELLLADAGPGSDPTEGAELLRQALLKHAATHTSFPRQQAAASECTARLPSRAGRGAAGGADLRASGKTGTKWVCSCSSN